VHISGIGADPASASPYVRARAMGERLVREVFPRATIMRPSVMFGPDHDFLSRLAGLARVLPVLPLFGAGDVRLQPVYVDDVAAAIGEALATPRAAGKLYELGGPRVYSYKALVQLVLEQTGKRRLLLPLPYFAWNALAALMAPLPARPISRDQVKLMQKDNVVSPGALTFADLGITPTTLEAVAPTYLRPRVR
jgi:NADH dehydrogenase